MHSYLFCSGEEVGRAFKGIEIVVVKSGAAPSENSSQNQ